jgi:hypothetical protein
MADFQYRSGWYDLAPPWLRTDNGERYMYTLELMRDLLCEKANQAVRIRMPGLGDASQIPYLAHDRQLVQGPNEPDDAFISRLRAAFPTWASAGSAQAVLLQLQAYTQGFQPGIDDAAAVLRIVSDKRYRSATDTDGVNSWYTVLSGDAIGQPATLQNITPHNFNWSTGVVGEFPGVWRAWLVLYQYAVATGQTGAAGVFASAGGGSFTDPGHEVGGVWVPRTTGTPVNAPFIEVTGLSGLSADNVGDLIAFTGSAHIGNNHTFQIVGVTDATSCTVVGHGFTPVVPDAGPLGWSLSRYAWIPPGLPFGTPGATWGDGELSTPPVDTGTNRQGNWQPTALAGVGQTPTYSWGLHVSPLSIATVRGLLRAWKSAGTYYPNIIVCYDGADGAFSPTQSYPFNPDGGFGPVGFLATNGAWLPTRRIESYYNAFCQGTGQALACGVENIT